MRGIILVLVLLAVSLILGRFFDQLIDQAITNNGPENIPLLALKILLGLPTDVPQWILKLFSLAVVGCVGEVIE